MLLDLDMNDLTGVLHYVAVGDCACDIYSDDTEPDCVTCAARRLIRELCEQAPNDPYAVALRQRQWEWDTESSSGHTRPDIGSFRPRDPQLTTASRDNSKLVRSFQRYPKL